jgi:hypothetical protein
VIVSGFSRLKVNFDATSSPNAPQATGMFLFDDVNANGIFEPGLGDNDGVNRDFNDGVNGEPMYYILQPTITMSYS